MDDGHPSVMDPTTGAAPPVQTSRFGHLSIAHDERVLAPRAWTAHQSRWAASLMGTAPPGPVLELCAGAGQIGLLAISGSTRELVMVDANPVACEFARRNADVAGLGDRVEVREGDLREVLGPAERFPVIIADPPYLTPREAARYPEDPPIAVVGGADGLDLARACVDVVCRHLLPGGSAVLQLRGSDQVTAVRSWLDETGELVVAGFRSCGRGALALLRWV